MSMVCRSLSLRLKAEAHERPTTSAPRAVSERSTGTSTRSSGSRKGSATTKHGANAPVTTAYAVPPEKPPFVFAFRRWGVPTTMTSAETRVATERMEVAVSPVVMWRFVPSSWTPAFSSALFARAAASACVSDGSRPRLVGARTWTTCNEAAAALARRLALSSKVSVCGPRSIATSTFRSLSRRMVEALIDVDPRRARCNDDAHNISEA